jgi:UDP-glucose 4-epimerase
MIVVTGGLGFIGSHTSRALLDRGESCLLVQRRGGTLPGAETEAADKRLVVAQADLRDRDAFLALGRAHRITGIVHLAGSVPWPPGAQQPVAAARDAVGTLLTVVQAAVDWGVPRVTVASTIGVYAGIEAANPLPEELPLSMSSPHVIPAFKKVGELLTDHLAGATGVEIVNLRISAVWGPLGRPTSPFTPVPQLVHAAAHGTAPDLSALATPAHSDDGGDLCYVKDCGRAIALLQTAPTLRHRTYNVAAGRLTSNREIIDAIRAIVPDARVDLPCGRRPDGPAQDIYLDTTRLREDTGYQSGYDTDRAVADYLDWLRTGHPR